MRQVPSKTSLLLPPITLLLLGCISTLIHDDVKRMRGWSISYAIFLRVRACAGAVSFV